MSPTQCFLCGLVLKLPFWTEQQQKAEEERRKEKMEEKVASDLRAEPAAPGSAAGAARSRNAAGLGRTAVSAAARWAQAFAPERRKRWGRSSHSPGSAAFGVAPAVGDSFQRAQRSRLLPSRAQLPPAIRSAPRGKGRSCSSARPGGRRRGRLYRNLHPACSPGSSLSSRRRFARDMPAVSAALLVLFLPRWVGWSCNCRGYFRQPAERPGGGGARRCWADPAAPIRISRAGRNRQGGPGPGGTEQGTGAQRSGATKRRGLSTLPGGDTALKLSLNLPQEGWQHRRSFGAAQGAGEPRFCAPRSNTWE